MNKRTDAIKNEIKGLRTYLGEQRGSPVSQREFAKLVGVSFGLVAAWEQGRVTPDAYIKLAEVSPPDLAARFIERAGLSYDKLEKIATEIAFGMPEFKGAVRFEVDPGSSNVLFSPGDSVYLDTSQNKAKDLRPFWRQLVLLGFPKEEGKKTADRHEVDRAYLALREELGKEDAPNVSKDFERKFEECARQAWPSGSRFGTLRIDLVRPFGFTAEFTDLEAARGLPHEFLAFNKLHHELLSTGKFGAIGHDTHSVTIGCWLTDPYNFPDREKRTPAVRDAIEKAPSSIHLFKDLRILGRVSGWEKKR